MDYVFVFDLDDTLLFHRNDIHYEYIFENHELNHYLDQNKYPKYIFTNGTYNHAKLVMDKMKINDKFKTIYARDTIREMKPNINSYLKVQDDIQKNHPNCKIIFADDNIENLYAAKQHFGWITVFINQEDMSDYKEVDYRYNTIIEYLQNFKII